MDSLILAASVVTPLLLQMMVGVFVRKAGILDEEQVKGLNKLIFNIFLPILMFTNVYKTDLSTYLDKRLITYVCLFTLTLFVISFLLVPLVEKENSRRGSVIQGIVRGNGAYFGIPVTVTIIGERFTGLMALVVAFVAIIYNITSVVVFEAFRKGKPSIRKMIGGIMTNPMIIGTLLGMVCVYLELRLPALLVDTLFSMSKVTTPLALVTLGAGFSYSSVAKYKKELASVVALKLFIIPLVAVLLAVKLGFRYYEICCIFSLFTAPTAVASYAVAQQMGGDHRLAGNIVVFTSLGSVISIFIWILAFGGIITYH